MKKKYPKRYIPSNLSEEDKKKQVKEIEKSKDEYREGRYYIREKIHSFKSQTSSHVEDAKKVYKIDKIVINEDLANKTGCSIEALEKIFQKGQGAYYSSGSRPNQTPHSWGAARLASALTGGKAAAVDFSIIDKGCDHDGIAYKMAIEAKSKYKSGRGSTPKTKI